MASPKPSGPDQLHSVTRHQEEVIDELREACQQALLAIASCYPYVDFELGLASTAREIEAAIAAADLIREDT